MSQKYDLHMHSTVSDGKLQPIELVNRATHLGLGLISITDHDRCDAYHELKQLERIDLDLIVGIEFSTQWSGVGVHVLAYGCDIEQEVIQNLIVSQTKSRLTRAELIAKSLEKQGLLGVSEWMEARLDKTFVGRPDFARFLHDTGQVKNVQQAFKKYLGAGKVGDVKNSWAEIEEVITSINESGGMAFLAHPSKYKLTNSKLKRLLTDFKTMGGRGIEVVSGSQTKDVTEYLARLSCEYALIASAGSDFHEPGQPWNEIGSQAALPSSCDSILNYKMDCLFHLN